MSEQRNIGQTVLALVTVLITVAGAGVAFLEYREAQQRARVERVFHYSDTLADESAANAKISQLGDDFLLGWADLAASAGENATPEQLDALISGWFETTVNADPDLRNAIERMGMFYDTLAVCVAEKLCDERTAKALFTEQIAGFTSTAYPWVALRKKKFFAATGVPAMCLRNRFCGGPAECTDLPAKLVDCRARAPAAP
jgi:hypothetical protein